MVWKGARIPNGDVQNAHTSIATCGHAKALCGVIVSLSLNISTFKSNSWPGNFCTWQHRVGDRWVQSSRLERWLTVELSVACVTMWVVFIQVDKPLEYWVTSKYARNRLCQDHSRNASGEPHLSVYSRLFLHHHGYHTTFVAFCCLCSSDWLITFALVQFFRRNRTHSQEFVFRRSFSLSFSIFTHWIRFNPSWDESHPQQTDLLRYQHGITH